MKLVVRIVEGQVFHSLVCDCGTQLQVDWTDIFIPGPDYLKNDIPTNYARVKVSMLVEIVTE